MVKSIPCYQLFAAMASRIEAQAAQLDAVRVVKTDVPVLVEGAAVEVVVGKMEAAETVGREDAETLSPCVLLRRALVVSPGQNRRPGREGDLANGHTYQDRWFASDCK